MVDCASFSSNTLPKLPFMYSTSNNLDGRLYRYMSMCFLTPPSSTIRPSSLRSDLGALRDLDRVQDALFDRIECDVIAVVLSGKLACNTAKMTAQRVGDNSQRCIGV